LDDIIAQAESLAAEMLGSRMYTDYLNAYNALDQDELAEVKAFKRTEADYLARLERENLSFDEEKRISNLYTALTLNERINTFLAREKAVCSMLTRVCEIAGSLPIFTFD
jgi:cell fate (sporulation/competence/biofilm development) regulator YlbF (YheA/YmcA/DUF963 family)